MVCGTSAVRCNTAGLAAPLQVDDGCRACQGGGTQALSERVEALALPVADVEAFLADEELAKTPGLAFGLLWGMAWLQRSGTG